MTQPSASVISDGMLRIDYVAAIADPAAPTAAELNAGTSKALSCYFTDQGVDATTNEETATDPRLCSRQVFEGRGRYTDSLMLTYVYNILSSSDDVARLALATGTSGYIVMRWGDDYDAAWTAGDIVDVYPITAGVQQKQKPTANTPLTMTQKMFIGAPGTQRDVVVV